MSKYFKNLAQGSIINRNEKPPVDLTSLPTDKTCKKLYLEGFKYIGITTEAKVIFKGCPSSTLEKLIAQKQLEKKEDEVVILQEILSAKKVVKKNAKSRVSKS